MSDMQKFSLVAVIDQDGMRLDLFVLESLKAFGLELSRTAVQKLIASKQVFIEGSAITKPNNKVRQGQEVIVNVAAQKDQSIQAEDIPLVVVYEDDDIAVIDKQIGLVVHPAPGNYEHTLVNALLHRFKKLSDINPTRPGIVHRLDKETSGILVVAKNNSAHLALARQFADHSIKRKYVALVKGQMEFDENVIEIPIGRHPIKRKNMSVGFGKNTKYAKTFYRTLKRAAGVSMLELEPFTGRTHQLRVHLAFIGHPILGDTKYARNNDFKRMALHARYLGFVHPASGKFVEFESPVPVEFTDFLKK